MPTYTFKSHDRLLDFWKNLHGFSFRSPSFLFYLTGWIFSFYALLFSFQLTVPLEILFVFMAGYFWFKSAGDVSRKLDPAPEIILVLLLLFYGIQYGWFSLFVTAPSRSSLNTGLPGGPALFIQILLLWLQVTMFSLLLSGNNPHPVRTLIWYLILGIIAFYPLQLSDRILWQIFQLIIFLILYRRTAWLEKLTRVECWIYFGVILILYLNFSTLPYRLFSGASTANLAWYFIPKVLSHLFNLYLLAVLVKIPFVLVYHHASLRRKLQIAGWLQSSIPLFIQLLILLFVFYFFIASWQAENLNTSLQQLTEKIDSGSGRFRLNRYQQILDTPPSEIIVPGYRPISLPEDHPGFGVVQLNHSPSTAAGDYFLFFESNDPEKPALNLVKMDTLFLDALKQEFNHIAANGIMTYPFSLDQWDSVLYMIRVWENSDQERSFRIFPFALIPESSPWSAFISLVSRETEEGVNRKRGQIKIMNQDIFTTGRLYTGLYDSRFQRTGYWAVDIVIVPDGIFFKSPIFRQFLFWFFIYFLVNIFIIQRVVKFGNRIMQIILHKFNLLTQGIRQISSGNLDYHIEMEGEDEFVELANRFNRMGGELQKKISEVREKDRLESELRIAREVQLSLLPQHLPVIPGYQLTATIQTATEVGGDFYDALPLDEHTFLLVIGDVSGKSTSAAFYMAQCISLIRFASQFSADPREILLRLNHYFSDPMIDRQVFVTLVIGLLDTRKHQVTIYRAGHNFPVHIPSDPGQEVSQIRPAGLGIGLERKGDIFRKILKSKLVKMKDGDNLFLYTDGIAEAASTGLATGETLPETRFFGEERLLELLEDNRGKDPEIIQQKILSELQTFYGKSPLIDDMTMLIIRRGEI